MAELKTQKTQASVAKFLASIEDVHLPSLEELIRRSVKHKAQMGA